MCICVYVYIGHTPLACCYVYFFHHNVHVTTNSLNVVPPPTGSYLITAHVYNNVIHTRCCWKTVTHGQAAPCNMYILNYNQIS